MRPMVTGQQALFKSLNGPSDLPRSESLGLELLVESECKGRSVRTVTVSLALGQLPQSEVHRDLRSDE